MISRVQIENFKSIRKIDLPLGPLTVLIGPNGSGKSNVLDVFGLMADAAKGGLSDGVARRKGFDSLLFRGASEGRMFFGFDFDPTCPFEQEGAEVHYELELRERPRAFPWVAFEQVSVGPHPGRDAPLYVAHRRPSECKFLNRVSGQREEAKGLESDSELAIFQVRDQTAYPTPYRLLRHMEHWTPWVPIEVGPASPVRQAQVVRSGFNLLTDASNLASVLHAVQQGSPAAWEDIEDRLRQAYPGFRHITFPSEGADGTIVLRWWEEPFEKSLGFSANLLSDGTLRLLALFALLASPAPPPLICIDEPEVGLHPDWVKLVAELAQSAAERTQLIIATHSPTFVSKVDPESVVVLEKQDGCTVAERLSSESLAKWLDRFQLGDLWLAGHIGGRV